MTESASESRHLTPSESDVSAEPEPSADRSAVARRAGWRTTWAGAVYVIALAVSAVCFLWIRKVHELSYPVPWPDEGSFLWPALAFRDHGSLYAPELYPVREVFWMPPGFMVLQGLVFKVWTFSLGRARLVSALLLLAALGMVAAMLQRSRVRFGHALLLILFLFSPIFQLAGNTARMETLVLLVACAGTLLVDRRRWSGVAVLALAPLVHPIGCVFAGAGWAYWFMAARKDRIFARGDRIVVAVVIASWVAYAVHVLPHFGWFYADMANQMKFKTYVSSADGGWASRLREPLILASLVGLAAGVAAAVRLRARLGALAVLCGSCLLAAIFAQGWLYDIYPAFAALTASVLFLEGVAALVTRKTPKGLPRAVILKLAGVTAFVALLDANWAVAHPFVTRSVKSSIAQPWALDPTYASREELYRVTEFLRQITPARRKVTVQFLPDADALLFESVRSPTLNFAQQTYYVTSPDVFIVHRSPWFPPVIFDIELVGFVMRNGVTLRLEQWQRIAHGENSEWLVIRKVPGKIDWR